jgi:hypothetical protein
MHRSGTSALAGVLARLGCDLPEEIMPANEFNPKGFYESLKAYNLNDAILAAGDSSWDDWQSFNPAWVSSPLSAEFRERGGKVLEEEYGDSPLFLLKDPRICRLLPFWQQLFDAQQIQPTYVLTHRNPLEVARSLETREGWPQAAGLLLWLRHVLDAETGTRGMQRCFTSYDRLLTDWTGTMEMILSRTGLVLPHACAEVAGEVESFLSASLRHSAEPAAAVAESSPGVDWVRDTFEILERWADQGEQKSDYPVLDRIRSEFDAMTSMFGPVVQSLRQSSASKTQELEEMQALRQAEQKHAAEKYDELLTRSRSEAEALQQQRDQIRNSARAMHARQKEAFEEDLTAALAVVRGRADDRQARLQEDLRGLEHALEQARAMNQHQGDELARLTEDRDRSTAEREALAEHVTRLEQMAAAYVNSTSWKITAPLRRIVSALRRDV